MLSGWSILSTWLDLNCTILWGGWIEFSVTSLSACNIQLCSGSYGWVLRAFDYAARLRGKVRYCYRLLRYPLGLIAFSVKGFAGLCLSRFSAVD